MNTPERAPTPEPVTPDLEEARKVLMRSHDCFEWIARCQDELSAFEAAAIAKGRAEERGRIQTQECPEEEPVYARDIIQRMTEALIWCGGSPSFGPDGEAREGWLKLCRPLIDEALRLPHDPAPPTESEARQKMIYAPAEVPARDGEA